MSWQKCPVCEGRGNVPQGFYARQPSLPTTAPLLEPCRSCDGKGVLHEAHALPTLPMRDPMLIPYGPTPPFFGPNTTKAPETGDPIPPLPVTCSRT